MCTFGTLCKVRSRSGALCRVFIRIIDDRHTDLEIALLQTDDYIILYPWTFLKLRFLADVEQCDNCEW